MRKERRWRNGTQRHQGKKQTNNMSTEWEIMEGGKKRRTFKKGAIILLSLQKVFSTSAGCKARLGCVPVRAIPETPLSLTAISFPRAPHLPRHWLWFRVLHPFVTFLSWHHAYRQVFMPVNLLSFPRVTLWISNRKNTKSPICFFITQRINTKWGSLLSLLHRQTSSLLSIEQTFAKS